MSVKSKTPLLCRFCGKPIAKSTEVVHVYKTQPTTHYAQKVSVQGEGGKWIETGEIKQVPYSLGRYFVGTPQTKAEVQKLVNERVMSLQYNRETRDGEPTGQKFISRFTTWDGESYEAEFFCSNDHAQRLGYAAARKGLAMAPYNDAIKKRGPVKADGS